MKSRGFTLIELIVVISIVAMLLALSLPTLRNARAQAKSTLCQTHLRQLLLEFQQYTQSENGFLPYGFDFARRPAPPAGYAGDPTVDPPMSWWWFDYLEAVCRSSLRDSEIVKCPSKHLDARDLARDFLCGNYGVNRSLCRSKSDLKPYDPVFTGRSVSATNLRHPAETLLVVDSGYTLICWWHAADEVPVDLGLQMTGKAYVPGLGINKSRSLQGGQEDDAINGRHPGKTVNIGFVDGHVGREKADNLLVRKIGEDNYANQTPLWDP
ncbi:MAG: prepilin-type N-terminal cleavage/methylation domain-containing protein [Sedimentisphaerales bacterium]|nr:prepilin-type N-terminal cleavage/methylation domain-containing protein [Sedimentisphaerales bacterium]